jgi:hypothetical protein
MCCARVPNEHRAARAIAPARIMSLTIPFLRASSPIKKREVADDESYYSWEEEEDKKQRKEVLSTLASAIRAKSQWYFKILQQKELPNKWTKEAQVEEGDDLEILFRYVRSCGT